MMTTITTAIIIICVHAISCYSLSFCPRSVMVFKVLGLVTTKEDHPHMQFDSQSQSKDCQKRYIKL